MTLVFDTSAISQALAGNESVLKIIAREEFDSCVLPLAVDAELRYGFAAGTRAAKNLAIYESFRREFAIEIMYPTEDTSVIYAELAVWARRHGLALSHNDFWIAAATIECGGQLLTLDQDFTALPQVRLAM